MKTFRITAWLISFLVIGIISASLSGCGLLPSEEDILPPPLITPAVVQYRTQTAALGNLVLDLRMSGSIMSQSQSSLSFGMRSGRLKTLHVQMGHEVAKDDPIAELDSGTLDSEIRIQALEVRKNELILRQLKKSGADALAIELADLSLQQQRIRLEDLQAAREGLIILSPFDGVVTYLIRIPDGEYVDAYQTVARIADPSRLVLYTLDSNASELPIGAEVSIEYKDGQYAGTVLANPSTLYDDPDENLRRAAIIQFDGGLPLGAKMGDSVRIIYVQDKRENVIVLPRTLINVFGGRHYVNVLEDGVRVEKDVELGLVTQTEAEIVKGLGVGDLVIVG